MTKNIGVMDKIVRLSVVLIICALYLVDAITGMTAIVLGAIAGYLVLTSFAGFSPIYLPFGFTSVENLKTKKSRKR